MLQPLDVLVCLKLVVVNDPTLSFEDLEQGTGIASSSIHRAVVRARAAGLLTAERRVNRSALLEFVLHGVRYVYYVEEGGRTRGLPTAHGAPPLSNLITGGDDVPVWPDPLGSVRGYAIEPLHKEAPNAARRDQKLYELLALVDALRIGRARERKLAQEELSKRLKR
ncbi:MAG: hypothetical protein WD314_02260 [Trueperaceae bacterium]